MSILNLYCRVFVCGFMVCFVIRYNQCLDKHFIAFFCFDLDFRRALVCRLSNYVSLRFDMFRTMSIN